MRFGRSFFVVGFGCATFAASLAAGCGGDDTVTTPTDSGGGSDSTTIQDSSTPQDSGTHDTGVVTDSGTDAGPTSEIVGDLFFQRNGASASSGITFDLTTPNQFTCGGTYGAGTQAAAATAGCTITTCTGLLDAGTNIDPPDASTPTAGTVTFVSSLDIGGTAFAPNATTGAYPVTGVIWNGGETTIEVKAAGGAVPAFDETNLVGPSNLTTASIGGTSVAASGAIAFPRASNLAIAYTGGTTNTTVLARFETDSTTKRVILSCNFDAATGTQSIASGDLQALEEANGTSITGMYEMWDHELKAVSSTVQIEIVGKQMAGTFTNSN